MGMQISWVPQAFRNGWIKKALTVPSRYPRQTRPVCCMPSAVSRLQQFFADPLLLKTRLERLSFSSVQKEASR